MTDKMRNKPTALRFASDDPQRRIFVGLSWDPKQKKSLLERLLSPFGHRARAHDLDLSCRLYDAQGNVLQTIDAKHGQMTNQSGHIYHSGDDQDGAGDGDDEQISVELTHLSAQIHRISFIVDVKGGHYFTEVDTPEIRLVNAYTRRQIARQSLRGRHNKFHFVDIERNNQSEWSVKIIDQYGKRH